MPTGLSHRSAERNAYPPPPYRSNTPLPLEKSLRREKVEGPPRGVGPLAQIGEPIATHDPKNAFFLVVVNELLPGGLLQPVPWLHRPFRCSGCSGCWLLCAIGTGVDRPASMNG